MKAGALLNVRNLTIGVINASQKAQSPKIQSQSQNCSEIVECLDASPVNSHNQVNIFEADVHHEDSDIAAGKVCYFKSLKKRLRCIVAATGKPLTSAQVSI